jgi:hypothetical protein
MPAETFNLTGYYRLEQGTTYSLDIPVTVTETGEIYDMTSMTAAAKIRETHASTTSYAFTCTITVATGIINIAMTATETTAIAITSGVWDLELTSGTTVTRLAEGTVYISPEVTKT